MTNWNRVCITDGSVEIFREDASEMATPGSLRTLCRHLDALKANNPQYATIKIDRDKAYVSFNGNVYYDAKPDDMSIDDILNELDI